ncbi:MAG: hypothetical protein WCC27_02565 [Acidobacteriaceae bacterium]
MQPAANPDDIHTILSRFQTWADQRPASGNGNGHKNGVGALEGLREIAYEEAIRQHRNRRAAQSQRRTSSPRASASPVPHEEQNLQAEPEPVAKVPSPSPVDLAAAKIAEVAAASKLEPSSPLSNDVPQDSALVATGVVVEPVASDLKVRTPRAKRVLVALPAKSEGPAPIPALATNGIIADAPLDLLKALPQHIPGSAVRERRPRPTTMAAAPIPAPTMSTRAAVHAKPTLKSAARRKPKTPARTAAAPKTSAPLLTTKPLIAKQQQFRQVLAKTVLQAKPSSAPKPAPKKEAIPDRTQRITTRFSLAEQRRIEKQAAVAGLTVSAWLRHCALSPETTPVHPKKAQGVAKSGTKHRRAAAPNPAHVALFSQPTNSALGNWLTLLRQRFLSSPARFSEQA